MKMFTHAHAALAVFLSAAACLHAEVRTFTSTAGTTIQGELVSVNGGMVTIKKSDGQPLSLKMSVFSPADQAWLQSQAVPAPAAGAADSPPSTAAIFSKSAKPWAYADRVEEIRWKGQPVHLEYRGPLAATVKPLGKITANVRALAFHPDGRLGFCFGNGSGASGDMGISFWNGKGAASPFLRLTYQAAPGDSAQRAEAEGKGLFQFFTGSLAFDHGGRCFFTSNSGQSSDALWLVKTTEPVLLERMRPTYRFGTLQIPSFDDQHLYAQTAVNIQKVSLETAKSWKDGMEEWFVFKGKDAYLEDSILLAEDRLLTAIRIKPPGSPAVDVTKPFVWTYQTFLIDLKQQALWQLPEDEAGPMAVSWDGKKIVRFHTLTRMLVEISLPGAQ